MGPLMNASKLSVVALILVGCGPNLAPYWNPPGAAMSPLRSLR